MTMDLNATITRRFDISHGLMLIQVTPDFELKPFVPGQYTTLGLPGRAPRADYADPENDTPDPDKLIIRAYSISSSSLQGSYLEFYVALVHSGALTPRLFAIKEGDRIYLGQKNVGMFTLQDVTPGHDVLFVATGTGLAPYISMLRSAFSFGEHKTIIIHGARTSWDLGYRNELEALANHWENFHYLPIISERERDPDWQGPVGFVFKLFEDGTVESLLGRNIGPERLAVFLCGNPLMIEGMKEKLADRGLTIHSRKQPGNIFVEQYWKD